MCVVDCRVAASVDNTYSFGVLAVFDWHPTDSAASPSLHAHFGGKTAIEGSFARRGKYIMIR